MSRITRCPAHARGGMRMSASCSMAVSAMCTMGVPPMGCCVRRRSNHGRDGRDIRLRRGFRLRILLRRTNRRTGTRARRPCYKERRSSTGSQAHRLRPVAALKRPLTGAGNSSARRLRLARRNNRTRRADYRLAGGTLSVSAAQSCAPARNLPAGGRIRNYWSASDQTSLGLR
jgi:hypothetical protein